MENRTNYRRTTRNAATAPQTGNAAQGAKTASTPEYVPFRCAGDITIHSKTGDNGRASYRMVLCNEDQNTGDPVFCSLWVNFVKDAKTLCGALPSNGKARIRVKDAFLSVSLANGNPVLSIMSADILNQ